MTEQYGGSGSVGGIPRKFSSVAFAANTAARLRADASDSKSDVGDTKLCLHCRYLYDIEDNDGNCVFLVQKKDVIVL